MSLFTRATALILISSLLAALTISCVKTVEQGRRGPSGLPTGTGEERQEPSEPVSPEDSGFPLYPGSIQKASGVYQTSDPIETVKTYYVGLLGMGPEVRGDMGEALAFETPEYELVLLDLASTSGGTEIRFTER